MRTTLIIFFLLIIVPCFGQEKIPFEQKAFDFYRTTILKNYPPKSKMTLWPELDAKDYLFWFPTCLKNFQINIGDSLNINPSGKKKIELGTDDRFKIKKELTGKYPRVYSTVSFSNKVNQHIVTIIEIYKFKGITYHIELNDKGEIINWCKGGWMR